MCHHSSSLDFQQQMAKLASVSYAREFDEALFTEVLNECIADFPNIKALRSEQKMCLFNLSRGKDVFAILPTGFGKSLIFQLFRQSPRTGQTAHIGKFVASDKVETEGTNNIGQHKNIHRQ